MCLAKKKKKKEKKSRILLLRKNRRMESGEQSQAQGLLKLYGTVYLKPSVLCWAHMGPWNIALVVMCYLFVFFYLFVMWFFYLFKFC